MIDYLLVLSRCFPEAEAYVLGSGDATNYNDLNWITTPIPQATLDASVCAQDGLGWGDSTENTALLSAGPLINFFHGKILASSGTSGFDLDDTDNGNNIPSITKGTELWSTNITPNSLTSTFKINFSITIDVSRATIVLVAVYRNSTLIGSAIRYCSGSDKPGSLHIQYVDKPNSTLPTVYSARFGKMKSKSGTWYVNRTGDYTLENSMEQRFSLMEFE